MKAQIINKEGLIWQFRTLTECKKYIKPEMRNDYKIIDGIATYDDQEEIYPDPYNMSGHLL